MITAWKRDQGSVLRSTTQAQSSLILSSISSSRRAIRLLLWRHLPDRITRWSVLNRRNLTNSRTTMEMTSRMISRRRSNLTRTILITKGSTTLAPNKTRTQTKIHTAAPSYQRAWAGSQLASHWVWIRASILWLLRTTTT